MLNKILMMETKSLLRDQCATTNETYPNNILGLFKLTTPTQGQHPFQMDLRWS